MKNTIKITWIISIAALILYSCNSEKITLEIEMEEYTPEILHGIKKLKEIENSGLSTDGLNNYHIHGKIDTSAKDESFNISANNKNIKISAGDGIGMMYALLHIREQLQN